MSEREIVSYREFARRIGVSDTAVHKNTQSDTNPDGLLRKSKTTKGSRPALFFLTALQEWVAGGGKINNEEAYKYLQEDEEQAPGPAGPSAYVLPERPTTKKPVEVDNNMIAAKRVSAVYNAKMAQAKYEKYIGKLVDKEKVYAAFYEFGVGFRDKLLQLPNKVMPEIKNMLANGKEKDALTLLYTSIEGVMLSFTEGPDPKKLTDNEETEDADTGVD